ncbi:YncE family protein [Xanthobacter agilis]|uniref:YVTN family beta-propeller protein n=1 Tax=Xanthobacter agilis TaxID=47492 RepID=A0ABU0LAB6_XANAG|nr:YncE family protein [Xanthobacter agilis]MDQ0504073.1 YVTN family beta-propeller protein [Xanthobacter agilis]
MKRRRALRIVTALLFMLAAGAASASELLVVCQSGAELRGVETQHFTTTRQLKLPKAPAALALSPDRASAFITHPDAGLLTRVDLARSALITSAAIGGQPFGIVADPDGRTLYVGDWSADRVRRLDAASLAETGSVAVGRSPAGLALDPARRELYSADREAGAVSIIDLETFTRVATVPVGEGPYSFDTSGDRRTLRVVNVRSGDLAEIDKDSHAVTRLAVGKMPYGAASLSRTGEVLVANQQSGTLSLVAAGASRPIRTLRVGGSPEGVAVDPSHPRAYVADWFSDQVLVVDLDALQVAARIGVCKGPRSLTLLP